jgi:hypothetical protein
MKQHIVTFTLLQYEGIANKWWALGQMGMRKHLFNDVEGLHFYKLLGSGGGNGFSIFPNFGVYALLCVWETEADANIFFEKNENFQKILARKSNTYTLYAQTVHTHGQWDSRSPFITSVPLNNELPLAVLTRATIKLRYLLYFWRFVPRTSHSIEAAEGRVFSVGVGEVPLIQQATFSLWKNPEMMLKYAYKSKFHSEVVKKTRELGWYEEELFARFHPYKETGSWQGLSLLNLTK